MGNKVLLTRHHVVDMVKYLRHYKEEKGLFDRIAVWAQKRSYGGKFIDSINAFYESLDPETTIVTMIEDRNKDNRVAMNLDAVCELGCPYVRECVKDIKLAIARIDSRWPSLLFTIFDNLIDESDENKTNKLRKTHRVLPAGEYLLSDLLKHKAFVKACES